MQHVMDECPQNVNLFKLDKDENYQLQVRLVRPELSARSML